MRNLVFISGATGGLGKALAVECANRGWDLFLTDLYANRLEVLAAGLMKTYAVEVICHPCDLTDAASRLELFQCVRGLGRKFQMLINVAGLDYEGIFGERDREEVLSIVRLNIEATLDVTHSMLAHMQPGGPFHIINVASLAAYYPMPVKATYAASKRFLLDFSLALRNEIREQGGTVTALCPAGLPTTASCIEAIEAQGLMGQLTTVNIGKVASQTVDAALRGQAVIIPGLLNQLLRTLGGLVPATSVASLIGRRWRTAHQKARTNNRSLGAETLG